MPRSTLHPRYAIARARPEHVRVLGSIELAAAQLLEGHAPVRAVAWNMPFYAKLGFEEIPARALRAELAAVVQDETARGLDPAARVVMRYRPRGNRAGRRIRTRSTDRRR